MSDAAQEPNAAAQLQAFLSSYPTASEAAVTLTGPQYPAENWTFDRFARLDDEVFVMDAHYVGEYDLGAPHEVQVRASHSSADGRESIEVIVNGLSMIWEKYTADPANGDTVARNFTQAFEPLYCQFKLHEQFKNYPFVKKAYDEQCGIARFLGGEMPVEYSEVLSRQIDTAEALLDGGHEEKEAVVVGCILITASPFTFDDVRRFETEYPPQVKEIVSLLLAGNPDAFKDEAILQQIMGIVAVADNADVIKDFENDTPPPAEFWRAEDIAALETQVSEGFLILKTVSPRLYGALSDSVKAVVSAVKGYLARSAGHTPPAAPDAGAPTPGGM